MIKSFPHYTQLDAMDCGPTCLRMIAKFYGRSYTLQNLREKSFITREGVSMLGISDAAESIGMHTQGVRINFEQFLSTITSNAFCIDEKMCSVFNEINLKGFQITLDGHRERHNKIRNQDGEPSYDKIIHNINLLCKNVRNIDVTLRINYDNQTLKQNALDILNDINESVRNKILIDLQRVWQTGATANRHETKDNIQSFIDAAKVAGYSRISCLGGLSVKKFYNCYASKYHYVEINYDGKIYKCTARGYTDEYVLGELLDDGSIRWNEKRISKLYDKPTFDNSMCLNCIYLPLCWGPCPQKIVETPADRLQDICLLKNLEHPIQQMIIDLYESSLKRIRTKNEV